MFSTELKFWLRTGGGAKKKKKRKDLKVFKIKRSLPNLFLDKSFP